jgi:hypothetical protein
MTPGDTATILGQAEQSAHHQQWQDVDHMLRQLYDQDQFSGTDKGDAAYLLGLSYVNSNAWDAAQGFLTEAASSASSDKQQLARAQLEQISHYDAANDAAGDGVDQHDAAAVLQAGDEALGRGDYADAHTRYWSVYDGHPDDAVRAKAALGIAYAYAYGGDLDQGAQFAHYVVDTGQPAAADAQALLTWITEQQGATAAAGDGTTPDEYLQVHEAAKEAMYAGDYAQALTLSLSILNAPQLAAVEHAKSAYNAGVCEQFLDGMEAAAREHFEFAVANGNPETAAKAQDRLTGMNTHDRAEELVADYVQ